MRREGRKFEGDVSREIRRGAEKEGVSADIGDVNIEDAGEYSIMSFVLRDKDIGKDIVFRLKVNNENDEVLERQWIEKDYDGERVIRYENFEAMRQLPHDAILQFKAVEEKILKSGKKGVN